MEHHKTILITGGAGYIGSHTVICLLNEGYDIVVLDNLSNSSQESLFRVEEITGKRVEFQLGDVRDEKLLHLLFEKYSFDSVVHFAGLKSVGESHDKPLLYYDNNISGTISLCDVMQKHNCKCLVFSSSATVYGVPIKVPIDESFDTSATNPYGRSKLIVEDILRDLAASEEGWSIGLLRYFNPVGAHESGLIGEDPNDIPNNLLPYISQVAVGRLPHLNVFGRDYPTRDGTGIRDYIHVVDLANGHLKALEAIWEGKIKGAIKYNLGTGKGYTVLDMVSAFENATGQKVNYKFTDRRPGDVAECWADPDLAKKELDWEAKLTLTDMMDSTWKWQKNNPNGYEK